MNATPSGAVELRLSPEHTSLLTSCLMKSLSGRSGIQWVVRFCSRTLILMSSGFHTAWGSVKVRSRLSQIQSGHLYDLHRVPRCLCTVCSKTLAMYFATVAHRHVRYLLVDKCSRHERSGTAIRVELKTSRPVHLCSSVSTSRASTVTTMG